MALKGNKGEWSELYVLVKLLAEGKLYQSDVNLERDEENVYDVIKAYKKEIAYSLEFVREQQQLEVYKIVNDQDKELVTSFRYNILTQIAENICEGIINSHQRTFFIQNANDFIQNALITKIKADPSTKADIKLRIYDFRLAKETDLGFSIKSLLGGDSTLFNTGPGNNFIYKVNLESPINVSNFNIETYNGPKGISKITYRLQELERNGALFSYKNIQSSQLWRNLKMVDGDLPEILGWALYYRWKERISSLKDISLILEDRDPLGFYINGINDQRFYGYKIKKFLTEAAMGMTSETPWTGEYDSFGGIILAKKDGDILCFHIYDFNIFRNYLLENTFLEQAGTGEDPQNPGNKKSGAGKKYYYGWLYEEDHEYNFKINLQVRFKE